MDIALVFNLTKSLIITTCFFVITVVNPIQALLFLILTFYGSCVYFLLLGADYLSFFFLIVYVGAISILFLFVVMMLHYDLTEFSKLSIVDWIFILFGFFQCFSAGSLEVFFRTYIFGDFGNLLYNHYIFHILVAGIMLLVALIGSIILTFNFKKQNKNTFFRQLSRSSNSLKIFKV